MSQWYYELLSEHFGPASEQEIHELIEVGTLSDSDRVRHEETDEWITVAVFMETYSNASFASDLSDLQFEFEETSAGSPVTRRSKLHTERSTLPKTGESSVDSPTVAQYYCQILGQILGPMDLDDLIQLVATGQLSRKDAVRIGEGGEWMAAVKCDQLSTAFFRTATETVQAAEASTAQGKQAVQSTKTRPDTDSKPRTKPTSPRQQQKRKDDAVIDEMLNDVLLSEADTKPTPRAMATGAPPVPVERPEPAAAALPPNPTNTVSPGVATPKSTARVSTAPKSSTKRSVNVGELLSALKKPLAGLLLVGAIAAGVMYFPKPGPAVDEVTTEKCIARMRAVYAELESLDPVGNKAGLERIRRWIGSDFADYVTELKGAGGGDDTKDRCVKALQEFVKFAGQEFTSKREFDAQVRSLKQALSSFSQPNSAATQNAPGAAPK